MCCEVYKRIKGTSSEYMNDLLLKRPSMYESRRELNLYIPKVKQIRFGYKSFTAIAPKFWNSIPISIRSLDTYKNSNQTSKKFPYLGACVISAAQNKVLNFDFIRIISKVCIRIPVTRARDNRWNFMKHFDNL